MSSGKVAEAQRLSKLAFSYDVCGRCHMARNHEVRVQHMALLESNPGGQKDTRLAGKENIPSFGQTKEAGDLPYDWVRDIEDAVALAGPFNRITEEDQPIKSPLGKTKLP
jgi:hypothetical protein